LFLDDANTPNCQKNNGFSDLGNYSAWPKVAGAVIQAEDRYNFVVHGLPPLGDEMRVSPLIWRKKLMDSISGNLG
jgi:hypothetical protein